jgi:nicotinamidase-related amidase
MSERTNDEEQIAELLAFALGVRPERITEALLSQQPPEIARGHAMMREALAALGAHLTPVPPSPELRERVLHTVAARRQKSRPALVVVDMTKDHLSPGVALEVPRAREVVPALRERLRKARAEGMPVIYVVDRHDDDDSDTDFIDGWGAHNLVGEEGAASHVWPDIAPESGDRIVTKPTYSAFTDSKLEEVLDELGVDSIVLTGCLTEINLMATAKDAMERGFAVEVPPDSQAGASERGEQATLATIHLMVPYGPARKKRLERLGRAAA